ncbi:hypothetical protein RY831_32040 [Noviherbaspirillum sp. CPCC 100848]|uniref:Uncharacterized protein n=1 Tax=Noviherbaspirillum album TaxID=3080276 RepID=A0ABU6JJV5_9BURK|nr:hypothetical protein [Noviherbaspirillum sp. CPCC 100848]MEC4723756.1 hypothetical protein [Noviherbaspirillum sp. CPCC 100848]
MPRKPESVAAPAVIKWTEEEWELIAKRLLEVKGRDILKSAQLDEVKAKDVFLAQDALPKARHRKLISLSQGFQAIRQRLHGIMQKMDSTTPPEDLSAGSEESSTYAEQSSAKTSSRQHKRQPGHQVEERATIQRGPDAPAEMSKPTNEDAGETVPATPRSEPMPSSAVPIPAGSPQPNSRQNESEPAHRSSHTGSGHARPAQMASPAATGEFIELARPFVSMVCQELANALVARLMEQGGGQAMSSIFQSMTTGATYPSSRESQRRQGQSNTQSYASRASHDESIAAAEHSVTTAQASDHHDDDHDEADVQPLFDPKLPPSANSAFKPMVALIGTSTSDFDDLQRYYPQLELKVVSLEDLRTAPSLRSCQRMIGLREDIPAPADDYLRKTFRNRYLRVIGGVSQVREQLNAWLANPGTINDPPRWPRKQGNASGKGQGAGFPKKRQFRRPKNTP